MHSLIFLLDNLKDISLGDIVNLDSRKHLPVIEVKRAIMCLRYILKCFGRGRTNYVRFEKEREQEKENEMGIQTEVVYPNTLQHHTSENENENVKIMWNDCPLYEDS
jgi:hypothetical protein